MTKNITISVAVSVLFTCLILVYQFGVAGRMNAKLDIGFGLIILRYFLLFAGVISFGLYLLQVLSINSFFYLFISILNIALSISALILFVSGDVILEWLHQCLFNLGVGFFMLIPVILKRRSV